MENVLLRAVGYRRVSIREQVDGYSLDAQENNVRQYIESQGWEYVETYTDAGISAKKDSHRPSLEQLMKDAEAHHFDVIVVDKVDRFYRHLRGLLGALDQLKSWEISFVSVQERLDFTTVWGKLTLTVLGTLAEIYIDNLGQETKKGKLQRAREGYWNGNFPYGYCRGLCSNCKEPNGEGYCPDYGKPDKGSGKELVIHPVESKVVKKVYDLYLSNIESDAHIAETLKDHLITEGGLIARTRGIPGQRSAGPIQKDTIRNILTNVFYVGLVPYYGTSRKKEVTSRHVKEIFPGKHPALVTRDEFDRVQGIRKTLYKTPRFRQTTTARIYPLSGLLRCSYCGRTMRGSGGPRGTHYYRDTTRIEKSGDCEQRHVRAEVIEKQVVDWLCSILSDKSTDDENINSGELIENIQARYNRVKELYVSGELKKEVYAFETARYEKNIEPLQKMDESANIASVNDMRSEISVWQDLTPIKKRKLLQLLTEAIFVQGSVLVGIQPTFSLIPQQIVKPLKKVSNTGLDGDRNRGA